MRRLLGMLLLLIIFASALVAADPPARQQVVAWLQGVMTHVRQATPDIGCGSGGAVCSTAAPAVSACNAMPGEDNGLPLCANTPVRPLSTPGTSTPARTAAPAVVGTATRSAPATTTTPALPPYNVSASDYAWAQQTLALDGHLDWTNGCDQHPSECAYYQTWAGRWADCALWLQLASEGRAASVVVPLTSECPGWYATAIQIHTADAQHYPQNASWDATWITNYERLQRIWQQV